jgi:hypothetical protein
MTDTDAQTRIGAFLMQRIADAAMGWAAMEPVALAFLAAGLGLAIALLWIGLARVLDRSALVWRPSRGFALGVAFALLVLHAPPPSLAAFIGDTVSPYVWRHMTLVDGAGLASGASLAVVAVAALRRRWRGFGPA